MSERAYRSHGRSIEELLRTVEAFCAEGNYSRAVGHMEGWLSGLQPFTVARRICCECGKILGVATWPQHDDDGVVIDSHGLCEECDEKRAKADHERELFESACRFEGVK